MGGEHYSQAGLSLVGSGETGLKLCSSRAVRGKGRHLRDH